MTSKDYPGHGRPLYTLYDEVQIMTASTYTRAAAIHRMNGAPMLATRKDGFLHWLSVQAKIQRIQNSGMSYRARLAAITASDTRKGRLITR